MRRLFSPNWGRTTSADRLIQPKGIYCSMNISNICNACRKLSIAFMLFYVNKSSGGTAKRSKDMSRDGNLFCSFHDKEINKKKTIKDFPAGRKCWNEFE